MKKKRGSRRVQSSVRFQEVSAQVSKTDAKKMPSTFRRLRREYLSKIKEIKSQAHVKSRDRFLTSLNADSPHESPMGTDMRKRILASLTDTKLCQDMRFVCSKHREEFERWSDEDMKQTYRFADHFTSALKAASSGTKRRSSVIKETKNEPWSHLNNKTIRESMHRIIQERRDRFRHTERPNPITHKDAQNRMQSTRYEFENSVLGPCLLAAVRKLKTSSHNDIQVLRAVRTAHSALSCRTKRRGGIPTQCSFLPNTSDLKSLMKRCQKKK